MGESINIREYINMFKKRSKIILIILVTCIAIGELVAFKINSSYTPMYTTSTRIRVNTAKTVPDAGYNPGLASANQGIVSTYLDLSKSKSTLKEVASIVGNDVTPESVSGMYTLTPDANNSEFVNITATHSNPKIAEAIANAVPTAFNNELIKTIKLDCIEVIDKAVVPKSPIPQVKTSMWKKAILGGVVLSIFVVLLMEFLNNKIVTPKDVEEHWQLPLIGVVPHIEEKKKIIGIKIKSKN